MKKVIHNHNTWRSTDDPCGEVGLYYISDDEPVANTILFAKDFQHLNGDPCEYPQFIKCDNCGQFMKIYVEDIIE